MTGENIERIGGVKTGAMSLPKEKDIATPKPYW